MNSFSDLLTNPANLRLIEILILFVCIMLFVIEGYKFFKYKMKSDTMDFSLLAIIGLATQIFFNDLFLSGLSVIFVLMIIGTYEIRESPVWVRLMGAFTITYGYLLFGTMFEKVLRSLDTQGIINAPAWLLKPNVIAGFFWSTMLWVLLIFSFAFFGKRFLLVSRFLSPQYVYLFVYSAVYLIIFTTRIVPVQYRYLALFGANIFLYAISGWLLTFLFQIKPLHDERSYRLVKEIETKIDTKIRKVGIVKAPILNAFAYGPFFDQRFAFIVKDINNFTDEELLGITAHEVAHLKGKHTFWLLWIGFIDLFLRVLLGIPLNTLDFAAGVAGHWTLFTYYLVNILFFAIALIFVRIMEANADKRAKEIGYGTELADALFTLEGFYRGIAGELGLNAQLLMDTVRTDAEEKRFTGEAAIELHNRLLNPSRYGLVMNLIVSHPPTTFRIAAMVSDDFSSLQLALMPILLIVPGTRGRTIKLLRKTDEQFSEILTKKYKKRFSDVNAYTSNSYSIESLNYYINRNVILISKIDPKEYFIGTLESVDIADNIVDPFELTVKTENGTEKILSKNYSIQIYEPGETYVGRKKQVMVLQSVEISNKGKYMYTYQQGSKTVRLKYLGINLKDLSSQAFILQSRGKYNALDLQTIDGLSTPLQGKQDLTALSNASFKFITYNPGKEVTMKGNQMKINLSPVVLFLYKKFEKENTSLVEYLIENKTKLTLYTSKDPDIGIPCVFTNIEIDKENQKKMIYYKSVGETTEDKISLRQLDALVLRNPYKLVQSTKEIGFFSKLFTTLTTRGSKFSSL